MVVAAVPFAYASRRSKYDIERSQREELKIAHESTEEQRRKYILMMQLTTQFRLMVIRLMNNDEELNGRLKQDFRHVSDKFFALTNSVDNVYGDSA